MSSVQLRTLLIVLGVIVLAIVLVGALGGGWAMGPGMMGWWFYRFNPWWAILMMLLMVLFWAALIGGVVLLVLWLVRQGRPVLAGPGPSRPLDILRERYARGEITREEYERMRHDLEEE